jgi:hypothetical protein
MKQEFARSELEAFAQERINAARYPEDYHLFRLFECQQCGTVPLELTITHHTGSKRGDFKGEISARCTVCDSVQRVLSFTGSHRKAERVEKPSCTCGGRHFYAGECERMEGEDGLLGFFDEGVVVAQCAECGRFKALVYTD